MLIFIVWTSRDMRKVASYRIFLEKLLVVCHVKAFPYFMEPEGLL
jgi:hypothetical protein